MMSPITKGTPSSVAPGSAKFTDIIQSTDLSPDYHMSDILIRVMTLSHRYTICALVLNTDLLSAHL